MPQSTSGHLSGNPSSKQASVHLLAGFLAIGLVIWTATIVVLYRTALNGAIWQSQSEGEAITRLVSAHFDRTAEHIRDFTAAIAARIPAEANEATIHAAITSQRPPRGVLQVTFADKAGVAQANSSEFPLINKVDLSDREHIRVHLNRSVDGLFISQPVLGRISNRWSVQFTMPVRNAADQLVGVVVTSYDLDDLQAFYSDVMSNLDRSVGLVGLDGRVRILQLAQSDQFGSELVGKIFQQDGRVPQGAFKIPAGANQEPQVGFIFPSPSGKITVISWQGMAGVTALMPDWWTYSAVWALVAVGFASVGLLILRQITATEARVERAKLLADSKILDGLLLLPEFFAAKVVGGAVIETRKPLPPAVRLGLERNIPKLMPRGGSTGGGVIKDRFLFERDDHEIIIASVDDQSQDGVRTVLAVDTSAVRRHETALIHLSKLSSLGEMAAGVAHELSQPLNVIRMTVYNIKGSLKPLSEASDAIARLDRIEKQVDRAANILKRMREYARSPAQRAKLCQLSAVAQNVAQLKSKSLESSGISLRIKETVDLHATIDPVSLEQVLLALISNAEDAIGTQQNDSRSNKREILVEINSGVDPGYALLSVENSGPLIPVELRDRIFEPFFTTKGSLGSSGLGLFAAFSIIRDAGGNLRLADGQICTRFEILIPAGDVA